MWIPPGDYRLTSSLSGVQNVTLQGAGQWYSVVHTSRFIDQTSSSGGVHIKDFAVIGEVTERVDSNPDNFVNGSLGPGSSVSGMWIQHVKVGLWLTGNNDNLVVENNRILDTTADGLNLNGNAHGVIVRNNFLRNQGDDSLAMWSLNSPDTNSSFENNTISQPNLANGIAIYGGTNIAVRNNLVSDTNALGSGIAISNQKFLDPFSPLAGTITVDGNTLVRTGAINPNWGHPMGALRVDSYDSAVNATVNITNTTITNSPYSAFEFVSGGGHGYSTGNVTVSGASVQNTGTVVVQAEAQGAARFSNVQATGVGVAGIYNCPYPSGSGAFTLTDGGGNSGWSSTWSDCSTWPQPGQGNPPPDQNTNLAKGRPATATALAGRLHARQGGRRRRELLLGVHQQRLPAGADGRPRLQPGSAQAGVEAAAVVRVGRPHADAVRAGQHRRIGLLDRRRLHRLPLRPGIREHRHRRSAQRHEPALRAAERHRQHRLARCPVERGGGVPHFVSRSCTGRVPRFAAWICS